MASKKKDINADRLDHKGGKGVVEKFEPFDVEVSIVGVDPILFHRYDIESVKAKGAAAKGSKDKKTDNVESYVYRSPSGELAYPGINFKACLCEAAKFKQDPRSPRKSLRDLLRAAIKVRKDASFGVKDWDYEDRGTIGFGCKRYGRAWLGRTWFGKVRRHFRNEVASTNQGVLW